MGWADQLKSMRPLNAAIVGLVCGIVYYATFFDNGQKERDSLIAADKELAQLREQLGQLEKTLLDAQKLEKAEIELGASITKVINYIPENLTYSEMVRSLSEAARAVSADIGYKRSSQNAKQGGFYDEISVDVDLLGTFQQIVSFLSQLTKVDRIYTVDKMNFIAQPVTRSDRGSEIKVKFTTTVVGYKYRTPKKDPAEEGTQ